MEIEELNIIQHNPQATTNEYPRKTNTRVEMIQQHQEEPPLFLHQQQRLNANQFDFDQTNLNEYLIAYERNTNNYAISLVTSIELYVNGRRDEIPIPDFGKKH